MKKYLFFLWVLIYSKLSFGQLEVSYNITSQLFIEKKVIEIDQEIDLFNNSQGEIDTLYLNDWSNSYSSQDSQLALKFAEKFDRSFYYSSNKKKGNTKVNFISSKNSSLKWIRLKGQNDVIRIVLDNPIGKEEKFIMKLKYSISIPDISFSGGYGIDKNKYVNIKDYIISISRFENNEWVYQSNLDLNDNSLNKSDYKINWLYPKPYFLYSSIRHSRTNKIDSLKKGFYYGNKESSPHFIFSLDNNMVKYKVSDSTEIYSDIFKSSNDENTIDKIKRIYNFLNDDFKHSIEKPSSYLVSLHDYDLEPLYGLNIIPEILRPFDKTFINEIKFLKTFASEFIKKNLDINYRTQYWISDGLTIYYVMKYISSFYPEKKIIGRFSEKFFFKNYTFSKKEFNEIFMVYSELMIRNNLHQAPITSKDKLIKFNQKISIPYFVGQLFIYMENYLGDENFDQFLNNLRSVSSLNELKFLINDKLNIKNSLDILKLIEESEPLDFKIDNVNIDERFIKVTSSKNTNNKIPYKISLVRNDSVINSKWINQKSMSVQTNFNLIKGIDYVAINRNKSLPELNKINNSYYLKSNFFSKPLSIKLIKDFENPNKTQLLLNPILSYNLYDGPSFGARFHNKTLQRRPFNYFIEPTYSSYEKSLIGSFNLIYRKYKFSKSNYLTQLNLFGSSFHYAPNSLYKIIVPSINLYFRPDELISNLRHNISFSLYNIHRDSRIDNTIEPNYSIGQIKYVYSNKNLIDYFTINNSIEVSNKFNKINFEIQYRKLFPSARLLSSRIFMGTFMGNYRGLNKYFFFNLNRPNDYLFEYYYLGRSETDGFFSQQYIMNEGGFKSIIPQSSSNKSILAGNFSMGLWKWIEAYTDLGIIKNIDERPKSFYDYGLKLNFLPDYFEIFFPIASSFQNEINQSDYLSKIRFTLSLNSKQIFNLFSRTWF